MASGIAPMQTVLKVMFGDTRGTFSNLVHLEKYKITSDIICTLPHLLHYLILLGFKIEL